MEENKYSKEDLEKEIEELNRKIAENDEEMQYYLGSYYPTEEFKELQKEQDKLIDERNAKKLILEKIKGMKKLETDLNELKEEEKDYYDDRFDTPGPYFDINQAEKEEKEEELRKLKESLNEQTEKDEKVENVNSNEIEPKENEENDKPSDDQDKVDEDDKSQDEVLKPISITINKKTGEVTFGDDKINRTLMMNSQDYTSTKLSQFRKDLIKWFGIEKDDQKYMKNIDPTIFTAYYMYDKLKGTPEEELLCKEYAQTVIDRSKAIENGEKFKENPKLAKIKIDIGWHPRQKSKVHNSKERFGLKNIVASFRANRILKKHGMTGKFFGSKMDLATVIDNRAKVGGLAGLLAAAGTAGYLAASNVNLDDNTNRTQMEEEKDNHDKKDNSDKTNNENKNTFDDSIKVNANSEENQNIQNVQYQKENNRIQFGDEISVEKYSSIYVDSESNNPSGALGNNEKLGVNKIACQIDGKTYTTKDYTFDEIYDMAEKAGVDVRYHLDKMKTVDGINYVNVNDKYVYNDNGVLRTEDGKEWKDDVEYSSVAGWMDSKDVKKTAIQENKENQNEIEGIEI